MPVYEYRCAKCGHVTSFVEKMYEPQPLFFGRRRCGQCRSRKLAKIVSRVASAVQRTETEMMNELKSMGNVNFIPEWMMRRPEPPGGVCPHHAAELAREKNEASAKAEHEKKVRAPIDVS
ncbi:zinc ribbon domain-containing protein [bacterium]|nr:zinc ribbon domain-containing protein [bacterium]